MLACRGDYGFAASARRQRLPEATRRGMTPTLGESLGWPHKGGARETDNDGQSEPGNCTV
jgi:hypothetical protein